MENADSSKPNYWRKCTTCKNLIHWGQKYWICSVSTCNRVRTDLVFCDLRCFDAHVPVMNHRDAGAYEKRAPLSPPATPSSSSGVSERPKGTSSSGPFLGTSSRPSPSAPTPGPDSDEILVVASKVKDYIRSKSGMNTSASVMTFLSNRLRKLSKQAIAQAEKDGRKTVMDRDF